MVCAKHLLWVGLVLLIFSNICAQPQHIAQRTIRTDGLTDRSWIRELQRDLKNIADTQQVNNIVSQWLEEKQNSGWLELALTDIQTDTQQIALQFHQGPRYIFNYIQLDGLPVPFIQRSGLHLLAQKKVPVSWDMLDQKLRFCLDQYQNEGYPFASFRDLSLSYKSIGADSVGVGVSYRFDPGPLIKIDSILLRGNYRERDAFVYSLSRLAPGDFYNQQLISDLPRILNNSIYYQQVKEPQVTFKRDKTAKVQIDLQKKETSKLDVLLGILPPADNTQRLQFTGSVDIALVSMFRQGELIQFQFDKLTASSQQTYLSLLLPYLFKTPLRIEGKLDLRKQEEDFQNINWQIAGLYALSPFLSAKFYLNNRNSRLLGNVVSDTSRTNFAQLDGSRRTLGLGFIFENLDYRWNPSRGWDASLEIGIGTRTIRENVLIKQYRPEYYLNLNPEQSTKEVNLKIKWYRQLWPRHVIHLSNQTYWLGMDTYLRNDQLQVGGGRSIRGFNEQEFFTDFYSFFTFEYRLLLERNSYLFTFGDYAYLQNRESRQVLHPLGLGIGMNYGTKAGILSITYAVGRHEQLAFQPSRGKIHIGLINQF